MTTKEQAELFARLAERDHDRRGQTSPEAMEALNGALGRIAQELSDWTGVLLERGFGWRHPLIEAMDAAFVGCCRACQAERLDTTASRGGQPR